MPSSLQLLRRVAVLSRHAPRSTWLRTASASRSVFTVSAVGSAEVTDAKAVDSSSLPEHIKFRMPDLDFEHIYGGGGSVTLSKWRVHEGDPIVDGTHICEIDTPDLTFTLEAGDPGYIARILVAEDTKDVPPGQPLAIIVPTQEDIQPFLEALKQNPKALQGYVEPVDAPEADSAAASASSSSSSTATSEDTGAAVLRQLSQLHKEGHFADDKIYKMLKSLARKNDAQLIVTYKGSFDAAKENFDEEFFVETAMELAEEALAAAATSQEADTSTTSSS